MKPMSAPTSQMSGLLNAEMTKPRMKNRTGMPTVAPAQIMRYSLTLSLRSARASSRARLAPKSRPSTTLFRLARAWLWAMRSLIGPWLAPAAAAASGLPDA